LKNKKKDKYERKKINGGRERTERKNIIKERKKLVNEKISDYRCLCFLAILCALVYFAIMHPHCCCC
jgi:hypothetical protein